MFWTRFLFLMELIIDHVSRGILFGLMMLVVGAYFLVWVMVIPIYNKCNPAQVLDVDDGQFPA